MQMKKDKTIYSLKKKIENQSKQINEQIGESKNTDLNMECKPNASLGAQRAHPLLEIDFHAASTQRRNKSNNVVEL